MIDHEPETPSAAMNDAAAPAHRFLSGAEMEPGAVLAAHPGARFVARARLGAAPNEIWGIVIRLAAPHRDAADLRDVTTDDGQVLPAAIANDGRPTGDPAAILAAAKYWELPAAYVNGLVMEEDPV